MPSNPRLPRPESRRIYVATVFGVVFELARHGRLRQGTTTTPRAIASRPLGVSEAFLCVSIRFSENH